MTKVAMPPVSVIVESDYELRWVGAEPIAQLVARTGARVGSVFITTTQAEAYAAARVCEALEAAISAVESCRTTGTIRDGTTDASIHAIRALIPSK